MTDKNSSRVTAPPGGKSSVTFCGDTSKKMVDDTCRSMSPPVQKNTAPEPVETETERLSLKDNEYAPTAAPVGVRESSNNYNRPGNRQNVGNYITGRNTSRVLAPPGGGSSLSLG